MIDHIRRYLGFDSHVWCYQNPRKRICRHCSTAETKVWWRFPGEKFRAEWRAEKPTTLHPCSGFHKLALWWDAKRFGFAEYRVPDKMAHLSWRLLHFTRGPLADEIGNFLPGEKLHLVVKKGRVEHTLILRGDRTPPRWALPMDAEDGCDEPAPKESESDD